jgi:hypothetical protein
MKTVQLVVTGRCEELALHDSLGSLFPGVQFLKPIRLEPFTSNPLEEPPPPKLVETGLKFARKLVERVDELDGALVIGIEDQEFDPEPARQIDFLRARVVQVLDEPPSLAKRTRLAEAVSQRCSFHRLVPMVEAYFFADPRALQRAGAFRASTFNPLERDVEDFEVSDTGFLAPPDGTDKDDWARGGPSRARHPKRYLKYLSGTGQPGNWTYRESKHGVAAPQTLDWRLVAATETFATSLRALVADIADWLGEVTPLSGEESPLTARHAHRDERVLRNL